MPDVRRRVRVGVTAILRRGRRYEEGAYGRAAPPRGGTRGVHLLRARLVDHAVAPCRTDANADADTVPPPPVDRLQEAAQVARADAGLRDRVGRVPREDEQARRWVLLVVGRRVLRAACVAGRGRRQGGECCVQSRTRRYRYRCGSPRSRRRRRRVGGRGSVVPAVHDARGARHSWR